MTQAARMRAVSLAAVIGWLAGVAATFPLELAEALRNAGGDWKLLVASLGLGMMIWAMWTLGMAGAGWLVAGLPVAMFARPEYLGKHRVAATVISGLAGVAVISVKFNVWSMEWTGADFLALRLYAVFLVVFSAVTAWAYIRLLGRTLRRSRRVRISVPM